MVNSTGSLKVCPSKIAHPDRSVEWTCRLLILLAFGLINQVAYAGRPNNEPATPVSAKQPSGVNLSLQRMVSDSKMQKGGVVSYTIVLTNSGTTTSESVDVLDSLSKGLLYLPNTATIPAGSNYTAGMPYNTLSVGVLTPSQSVSLTYQARVDSTGIMYGKAIIPGSTALSCTSVPVMVCKGDQYEFVLTAAPGRSSYQWTKDGMPITRATSNTLAVTSAGEYKLAIDNVDGKCPDFSCCPFIVTENDFPTFSAKAIPATCKGNIAQSDGQLVLSNFTAGHTYQYSAGSSFDPSASLSGDAKAIPADGKIAVGLVNPSAGQSYTIRVYNASGCYAEATVTLSPNGCMCPADVCVPFVVTQSKRSSRQGG